MGRDYRKAVLFEDIDRLRELKEGWDSYGALPITEAAMQAAKEFVSKFRAIPTNSGGVGFEVTHEEWEISVDFMPDGTVESALACWEKHRG